MAETIYFYRWGNLNPIKHKEARKPTDSMHVAPRVKGIYAFPRGYIERFLISGSYTNHCTRPLLDEDGKMIESEGFWEFKNHKCLPKPKYLKLLKKYHIKTRDVYDGLYDEKNDILYVTYKVRPHKFTYKGELWHHLGEYCDPSEIIDKTEYWAKTSFKVYCKALHRCDTIERFHSYLGVDWKKNEERHGDPHTYINTFTKDHYEVFIEHIK